MQSLKDESFEDLPSSRMMKDKPAIPPVSILNEEENEDFFTNKTHKIRNCSCQRWKTRLDHLVDHGTNKMLVVTELTVLIEVAELLAVATSRSVELESPQEVVGLLEVRTNSVDLMN